MSARVLFFVATVVVCAPPARADRAGDAREHYQNATAHFAVGEFADAATEFQAAYKLKPDPALLFNAAQAYRLADNLPKALILYKNYMQLYPNEANIDEVRSQIAKLQQAVASATPTPASRPTPPAEQQPARGTTAAAPSPAPSAPITTPGAPAPPAALRMVAPQAKRETPVYKRWWLWTIVGVVAAGGAVTTAVLLTRPHTPWSNAPDVGPGSSNALVRW